MAYTNRREPFATDAADAEEADTDGFVAPLRNAKGELPKKDEVAFEQQSSSMMLYTNGRESFATDAADAEEADTDGFVAPLRNAKAFFLPGSCTNRRIIVDSIRSRRCHCRNVCWGSCYGV